MRMKRALSLAIVAALALAMHLGPARAVQGSGCIPTTGTVSGLAFAQDVNAAIAALISSNSGASAPATDCTEVAIKGQIWLDTSSTPNVLKQYDGSDWEVIGTLDATNNIWTPPVGGGLGTLASAATTDLGSLAQAYVSITGTTDVTSLGSSAVTGTIHWVKFAGELTLTYDADSLILPGDGDIITAAGDQAAFVYLGSGNWRCIQYSRATGDAVVNLAIPVAAKVDYFGFTAPDKFVFGYGQALSRTTYPDYLAAVTSTQSVTRTSASKTLTGFTDTSQFGSGMPIEGTGIATGATISSCAGTSCTISDNATSSGTGNVTVFAYGYGSGGSTTTVGVPDCRGRVIAGRDNMGGTAASRLTSSYFGKSGSILGAADGSEKHALTESELPTITPTATVTDPGHKHDYIGIAARGGGSIASGSGLGSVDAISESSLTGITVSISSFGADEAHSITQPTMVANCIIRVLK